MTEACLRVCVCESVGLSVCPPAYLRSNTRDLYRIFCACCLWPWLGPPPAGLQNLNGKGQFLGVSSPLTMHCKAFAAKGVIQSPITATLGPTQPPTTRGREMCTGQGAVLSGWEGNRRSGVAPAMRQKGSLRRVSCKRDHSISAGMGVMGVQSTGEV